MKSLLLLILVLWAASAFAQNPPASSKFDQSLLGGTNPELTPQEKAGVDVTDAWRDKSLETLVGHPGQNASVQFRFGESLPSIVTAILQVTDVELQAGEMVTHVNLGDSTRWTVESAVSGSGANQISHLIIKPRDIGLSTSLVVTTDRRTYHLLLVSDEKEFMHDVTFIYGEPAAPVAAAAPTPTPAKVVAKDPPPRHRKQSEGKTVARQKVKDDADENYVIQGKPDWKPVSAYTLNGKTYIEMPASAKHGEAPVLFEEKRSGLFGHKKELCNYRVHGKWYCVDRVLDSATLVSGVGSAQQRVTIRHAKTKEVASGQ
jgi:P-type conjugative transfer protein TrbG